MTRTGLPIAVGALLMALCPSVTPTLAQMLDPSIDLPDEPFCYFSQPTDVIGVMDSREGTLVSPEGYLFTGFGELMFFTGDPPEPVHQRVKTLAKGYLPVVEYAFDRGGIRYAMSMFAATLDGKPEGPLVNFIRVRLQNLNNTQRAAFFAVGTRYLGASNTSWGRGDNRFARPQKASHPGGYEQAGVEFKRDWEYAFGNDSFMRDGRVFYLFPALQQHSLRMTLKTGSNESPNVSPQKLYIPPTTPVGMVQYQFTLKPQQEEVLDFKMPYEPVAKDSSLMTDLRAAGYDDYLRRTIAFWEKTLADGMEVTLPEEKVENAFKTNLIYDLIARDKVDTDYVQTVNKFQYHAFWLRDASYIIRMYDLTGYHRIARQCLGFFPRWQQPDGNFVSQGGQFDGWGQAMWAYGEHFRMTRDRDFAESVFPSIERAVDWLRKARAADPMHLIPATTPGDNEDISGHVTGHNFIALAGLKNIIALADGIGRTKDAESFRHEYEGFREALLARLHAVTAGTGGYMPPGLDSLGGQDWGNMESVYPEVILDPHDAMVTATLNATRAKYKEGIMTYGDGYWMHHYLTMFNTETEVVRGDQEMAINELYALLVHTSATHAGFEFCIVPWGTRDFGMNLAPHGWFAARFRSLVRNMLVREQGNELHLFSCLSPEWIRDGATVAVRRAPTNFGPIDAELRCTAGKALFTLKSAFVEQPGSIVLHLPWFMDVHSVTAGGASLPVAGGVVKVAPGVKTLEISWTRRKDARPLSYAAAVADYQKEYRERYEDFLKNGEAQQR